MSSSMNKFSGFHEGNHHLTPVPAQFFYELLPEIDDLGELKVTLTLFWKLDRMEGVFRYLRRADFSEDGAFMQGLGATPEDAQAALSDALERAVQRGTVLRAMVDLGNGDEPLYFLNSPKGRAAVQAIERGEWQYSGDARHPVTVKPEAPNIFRLYEEHLGLITPMIADALRDAEATYPAQWIEEAIRIAVENNVHNWRYVAAILARWQEEGRDERKDRSDSAKARRRYVEGEYSDYIEH
jgi:DNA replication protein